MRESLYAYCLRSGETDLLAQWDRRDNGALTPADLSYGSKQKVWWTCEKGHRWQATVTARTSDHTGCPMCAGKRPDPGVNDLATLFPHLAAQWDQERNGDLTPDQVLPGSHRKVWWQCPEGHRWQAFVKSRVGGAGCPVCQHRALSVGETDLAACFPALAAQWDQERNGDLTPKTSSQGPSGRSGGGVRGGMCGRPGCPPGPRMGRAARCAPGGRSCPGKTIWPPSFPRWPRRGTRTGTAA